MSSATTSNHPRLRNQWHERRFSNRSIAQAKANARFHCALGTDFYRLWLDDPLMMYTCAYRKEGTRTQEEAQRNKVVSIGVLEHAGRDQLREVIQAHADFLKPGGLGMLHFIGRVGMRDTELYIRDHVFPGGWIPSLAEAITAMEDSGLEVLDVENLRRHYALTLDAWAERFERKWPTIQAIDPNRFDERVRRVWRTYLISCAEMFRSPASRTYLFQVLFSKGNVTAEGYPMSRAFLYRNGETE